MSHPFKVGDIVKCVTPNGSVHKGQVYTVLSIIDNPEENEYFVIVDNDMENSLFAHRFSLVKRKNIVYSFISRHPKNLPEVL